MKNIKEYPVPEGEGARQKRAKSVRRKTGFAGGAAFVFAVLAVLSMVGAVVAVIIYEFRPGMLLLILGGSFAGGALLGAGCAVCLARLYSALELRAEDYDERCVSPSSFFVGAGTFATFNGKLVITSDKGKRVEVPYGELKLYSVCTRKAPKEKGAWSVLLSVPARYLDGKGEPLLIQVDAKPRLYKVLEEEGLSLIGELPSDGTRKFTPISRFSLPDRAKRSRSVAVAAVGGGVTVAGILVAALLSSAVTIGVAVAVLGGFLCVRCTVSAVRARAIFGVYEEGIFWRDPAGADAVFLKWGEIEKIRAEERKIPVISVTCPYGEYAFPRAEGAYECVRENAPKGIDL